MENAEKPKLTAEVCLTFQRRLNAIQPVTIGAYKALGRELRDTYGLTDIEAINILNGRHEIEIIAKYEGK